MARLTIIAALLVALVALAEASTYRTTVITTEIDDENPPSRQCRKQLSRVQMDHCKRYLQQGMQLSIISNTDVPQECCQQLQQLNKNCRCEAIGQMMQEMTQGSQGGQMQEIMQKAQQLPNMCGMEPRQCQIYQNQE